MTFIFYEATASDKKGEGETKKKKGDKQNCIDEINEKKKSNSIQNLKFLIQKFL